MAAASGTATADHEEPARGGGAGEPARWVAWATASLRRQTAVTLRGTVVLLVTLAALCSTAVVWSAYSLGSLNETAVPLQVANKEILQDVTDAEASIRGYALADDDSASLQPYRVAIGYLPQDEQHLRELAEGDAELTEAVRRQEEATDRWLEDYVELQVDPALRLDAAESERLRAQGRRLYDDVRSANAQVDLAIERTIARISDRARAVLFWTLAAVVLVPLVMIGVATAMTRRLEVAVHGPLDEVSQVLARLREGDLTARVREVGPEEVREIAVALNRLAEDSLRGRDMEETVVSQLGEIDRVRTELVSTVSHELRTPLTSVMGYLELLEDQVSDQLDDSQKRMLAVVRRNLLRLQELISNLLTLSRVEEAGLKIEALDLRVVASEVVGDLRLTAASRSITLRTIQSASPILVLGDRTQLFRALTNLVSNAVKFSEPGDVVEVRVAPVGREAMLEVVDEGIGIPAPDLDGLGSRFFRASNATRSEIAGTGLGLRIVQTIVDRHGGTLGIESVEDAGTTVTVRLPLTQASGAEEVTAHFLGGTGRD
ncbi:HAMP domain-containing protein [Nocardioides sp. HDW12B]|uniref:ATP-binding protein n=1 Tax=Nocardioides sp. HDW12B TaxID=2714939 RepID=UPI00140C4CFB|nr:ATP-binding protein [Nocardioides sp. HDW12B]QIK67118.1 HAMP domain-containing protein [Nocardioides sp. HDW12B]